MKRRSSVAAATAVIAASLASTAAAAIVDPSFENPDAGAGLLYQGTTFELGVQKWAFFSGPNQSGLAGNGNALDIAPAPDGDQVAFLTTRFDAGPNPLVLGAEVSQDYITLNPGAYYTLSFYLAGVPTFALGKARVILNGNQIGLFEAQRYDAFTRVETRAFQVQVSNRIDIGTYNFAAGFGVAFDNVALHAYEGPIPQPTGTPEPASWALMILGFGVVGAAMRRRVGLRRAG